MKQNRSPYYGVCLLAVYGLLLSACAPVQPWQRGNLAKAQMALDPYPMLNEMRSHNYGSREGAAGSSSSGGGGCGCY